MPKKKQGPPKLKLLQMTTLPNAPEWSKAEEQSELLNEWRIWRTVVTRLCKKFALAPLALNEVIDKTYGEWHWSGILEMPWKHLLRDLERTLRLQKEEKEQTFAPAMGGADHQSVGLVLGSEVCGYTQEDADEEGLTIVTDLVDRTVEHEEDKNRVPTIDDLEEETPTNDNLFDEEEEPTDE